MYTRNEEKKQSGYEQKKKKEKKSITERAETLSRLNLCRHFHLFGVAWQGERERGTRTTSCCYQTTLSEVQCSGGRWVGGEGKLLSGFVSGLESHRELHEEQQGNVHSYIFFRWRPQILNPVLCQSAHKSNITPFFHSILSHSLHVPSIRTFIQTTSHRIHIASLSRSSSRFSPTLVDSALDSVYTSASTKPRWWLCSARSYVCYAMTLSTRHREKSARQYLMYLMNKIEKFSAQYHWDSSRAQSEQQHRPTEPDGFLK